ncbi:MAG TPA: hypothetical protein VHU90_12295, partial [Galbitalea sp.]|nr:hypothetical protein [Galbitalea sp.]
MNTSKPPDERSINDQRAAIEHLLEQLPATKHAIRLRAALLREAARAAAQRDSVTLERLLREVTTLCESLGIASGGAISRPRPTADPADAVIQHAQHHPPPVIRRAAGPGLPEWGQPQRSRSASWRRPQAPITYPYGDPPTGPDTRKPASDILPSPPLSSMPLSRRNTVHAIRYQRYEEADARMDALQRIGHLDRCGADDD